MLRFPITAFPCIEKPETQDLHMGKTPYTTAMHPSKKTKSQLIEELRKKTTLLETIVNAIPDIICLKDGDGRWLLANDYDLDLFELEGVDYKGKTDADLAPHSEFYKDAFLGCMDTDNITWAEGVPSRVEEIIPRPDGSTKVFDVVKIPLFNPDGSRHALAVAGRDITKQKELDRILRNSHAILEEEVSKRTKELREIAKEQQKTLQTLKSRSMDLHDANIALNVLLNQGREAKQELETKILENIKKLVFPYLDELDMKLVDKPDHAYVNIIRQRLTEITSSFSQELSSKLVGLTPRELQVTELVKQGRGNKDIAHLLHISTGTVDVYRNNIRKKLGLKKKKINLRSYLLTHY
jgi:PAS domain S-box-containing protein